VTALAASRPSTVQKVAAGRGDQIDPAMTAPVRIITSVSVARAGVQRRSRAPTATASTIAGCTTLPMRRSANSSVTSCSREPAGRSRNVSNVPLRILSPHPVDRADGHVGQAEGDAGRAVEEGDLLERPTGQRLHLAEQQGDAGEVEAGDQERGHRERGERRPVLEITTRPPRRRGGGRA
jgi:hypothetical protein